MRLLLILLVWTAALRAQPALEKAISLTRQHRFREAREALRGLVPPSDERQRITFHRVRAAIASGLQEHATASDEMRAALAVAPADTGLLLATAAAELAAGQLDNALQHAQAVGNNAAAAALTAEIQEKRGAFVEAANAYQRAVELAPGREEYRVALALELVQHQTFRPAIAVLEQAAPLFPQSARVRTLLGVAHYALGNNEPAVAALTEAVRLDPSLEPAHAYLTQIVMESSAAPPQPAFDALCHWDQTVCAALQLRQARESNDASLLANATRLLEQAPPSRALARCELGRAYEWTERWPLARTSMEACVKLDPAPPNRYRLALIYRQLGLESEARRELLLRDQALKALSEEGARRLNAVQAFQYTVK